MGTIEQPLDFWLQDLERRRTFAKPEHCMRGFFFKGLLENIRTLGDEALVKRCTEACGQEHFVDLFNYSVQLLFPILFTALPTLAERYGGAEAALQQLGRQSTTDFLASVPGKAMLLLAHGRPRLLLSSLPAAVTVSMNYGSARVDWTGPTQGHFIAESSFVPAPFHEGMVRQMLEAVRARGIHVTAWPTGDLGMTCEFSWT